MKNKTKFAFLSLALVSSMIFAACNKPVETTKSTEAPQSTEPASTSQPSSDPTTAKPSSSSSSTPSSSTSSTPSTSVPSSSSSSSSTSVAPTVTSIAVNLDNVKTAYVRGEALNLTGLVVTGTFSDGTSRAVRSYTTNPANGTVLNEVGEQEIVVTYKEVTTSFKVTVANQKFTVRFLVDGQEVKSYQVEDGQKVVYDGEQPTKAADANAVKYRFKGWDKDLNQPITQDTTINAVFAAYAAEQVVDNFEAYDSNADMADAWKVEAYTTAWGDTSASVVVGSKATEGNKSLRFNAWENGTGFRFLKHLEANALPKSANAIKFNLQIPALNTVKVILKGKATIAGEEKEPSFTYEFKPTTDEYVEYTIPLDADEWQLWAQAGQSIKAVADYIGIHQDDVVNYLTDVGFFVQGKNDGNLPYFAFVDNIRFVTLDEPVAKSEIETMGQYTKYTGLLNNGYTVKVELGAQGAATATILDAPQQQVIEGNVAIDANKNITFTSADNGATLVYKAALKNGGQSMKFVQAGGAFAEAVTNVDLNAVQVVDNFDQYTEDGLSYWQGNMDINNRRGCRGAYYSEYYSGTNPSYETFGGNGWILMGGTTGGDQLKLKNDGGHSGDNYLCMKYSSGAAMRYMQWGLFDGTSEQNNFRGSKLSFWAKTSGKVPAFKVAMYSQTKPRNATKDQYVKQETFTFTDAIGEWKHFEIDLNPNVTYYGFLVFMDKAGGSNALLYMDDVEVYTANPYATYVPEVPPVQDKVLKRGMHFMAKMNGLVTAHIEIEDDGVVSLAAPGLQMNVEGTYVINGNDVTMTFGQTEYMATIADDYSKLTYKNVTGTDMVAMGLTGLSFDAVDFAETAEFYDEDGKMYYDGNTDESTISGARGAYYCDRYASGTPSPVGGSGWALLGAGDQIKLDKTDAVEGKQSITFKRSSGANIRYMQWDLYKGTAKERTGVNKFTIFLKNPEANELKVKIYVFKNKQVTASNQTDRVEKEITLAANQNWTPYTLDLSVTGKYYGYGLYTFKGDTNTYLKVDSAFFSGPDFDPMLSFSAKKGVELSATTNAGPATIKFGDTGKVYLTCASANFNNVEGTYTMTQGETGQTMTIKIGDNTLTGVYAVDPMQGYKVTFTVTEAGGQFAALVAANTVFSN